MLERHKGAKAQVERYISETEQALKQIKRNARQHEQAIEIVKEVGLKTQQTLQFHISNTVSMALSSVFDDAYEMVVEFVQRRGKTECDLLFGRGDNQVNPLSASGGGAVDVASFALRVASWSMQLPRTRNVLLLDEPFKNVSEGLLPKASELLKQVSEQLGLQIIMVTHSDTLIESADNIIQIQYRNRQSKQVKEKKI
jgi:DNA repair exonuclease SbcCD ATPase subunit